jgi:hypothetical protein
MPKSSAIINEFTPHIIKSAVKLEMEFIVDALPIELIGMNSAMMCNYIKFCADRLLIAFGCRCHYKVGNPYEWMETIRLALESTAWTKLLLLTPASDGNKHKYIKNAYYIYIDQEMPSNTPLSHMCLLPRLYGNKHQTCEQEVTIKSDDF